MGVVSHELPLRDHKLHHRVPSVPDIDETVFIDLWPYVIIPQGHHGKGTEDVKHCQGTAEPVDPGSLRSYPVPDLAEDLVFQGPELLFRSQDGLGQFLQLIRGIALPGGQGLLADIVGGHIVFKGIADLYAVAEDLVELDL